MTHFGERGGGGPDDHDESIRQTYGAAGIPVILR